MPIAGILIANYGWESVFYTFGGSGIAFVFFWMLLVYDSPTKHPYITDREKALLETSLADEMAHNRKKLPVPWRSLLTSVPVWTATYVMAASGWSYSVMLSLTPTYLKNMMNYDITKTGIMSGLPYLLMYAFSVGFSYIIDLLRQKDCCSVSTLRKIANVVSQMGQGVCLIILSFSGCSEIIALILINTSGFVYGATYSGHLAVPLDLSPNFSGIIYAFNNLGFTFLAMLGPLISGIIITGHQTLAKWALVFRIAAAINISNVVLFTIFGSAEVQPWNDPPSQDDSTEEKHQAVEQELAAVVSSVLGNSKEISNNGVGAARINSAFECSPGDEIQIAPPESPVITSKK
ncbi:unnamed protein product [Notodromas monacha]|uniref:Sialin n=1 Tax=Notodromas monacha TaxID=399045 RepID=A0A7R9BY35_9CRUS|nr:unnamed protein product [Notodromas monacha]CAG0923867.1 unnamed protein product [Notodromas monacha]